jgi:metal-dependent amidase/aminoacylase/carboxypeptidase family protein
MLEHFDVRAEAREQYAKSQAQMEQLAQKKLSDVDMLDRVVALEFELHQGTGAMLQRFLRDGGKLPMTLVVLHEKTASEMRQAIRQKADLLGDSPEATGLEDLAEVLRQAWDVMAGGDGETD